MTTLLASAINLFLYGKYEEYTILEIELENEV